MLGPDRTVVTTHRIAPASYARSSTPGRRVMRSSGVVCHLSVPSKPVDSGPVRPVLRSGGWPRSALPLARRPRLQRARGIHRRNVGCPGHRRRTSGRSSEHQPVQMPLPTAGRDENGECGEPATGALQAHPPRSRCQHRWPQPPDYPVRRAWECELAAISSSPDKRGDAVDLGAPSFRCHSPMN